MFVLLIFLFVPTYFPSRLDFFKKLGGRLCFILLKKNKMYPSIYKYVAPGLKFPIMLSWPVAGLAHFSIQSYGIYGCNIAWDHD